MKWEQWLFLWAMVIIAVMIAAPQSKAGPVFAALGNSATDQVMALQGRGSAFGSLV